ncbi:MAG: SDR family oxidoreductase [Pseudomonadota bacterium]
MTILITGGSRGIGRAIAEEFATDRTDVFINYHADDEAAEAAAAAVKAAGGTPHLIKGSVATPEAARAVLGEVASKTDRLDQVVHAAVDPLAGDAIDMDADRFTDAVKLNGLGLLYVTQAASSLLGRGSTVFFLSSRGSSVVVPNYSALGASKALGESLVRYLGKELAPRGIRVNTVSAGPLDTTAIRAVIPNAEERLAAAAAANPSGRGLEFADVTQAVRWLASDGASMVQGQLVFVDGGLYL